MQFWPSSSRNRAALRTRALDIGLPEETPSYATSMFIYQIVLVVICVFFVCATVRITIRARADGKKRDEMESSAGSCGYDKNILRCLLWLRACGKNQPFEETVNLQHPGWVMVLNIYLHHVAVEQRWVVVSLLRPLASATTNTVAAKKNSSFPIRLNVPLDIAHPWAFRGTPL